MELKKKLLSVAALAFAAALSTGIAVSATAQEESVLDSFAITHVGVRTVGTQEQPDATGIRFKTTVGEDAATTYADADCYTTISFTSSAEGEEKEYSKDVAVQLWRADKNGWNTVLLGMTEADYGTEITAKSYIVVDENTVYETEAKTMSIEKAAAKAMQNGDASEKLEEYTKNAVSSIALDKATATVQAGDTLALNVTADAKYGVAWFTSDASVATVDKDGKVTGVDVGEATITAKMGNVEATCVVTVSARTLFDFESEDQRAFAANLRQMGSSSAGSSEAAWTHWEVAENVGAEGNSALAVKSTDWSRGMNLMMDTSWLKSVYETADYISFDVYTDATNLEYVHIESTDTENALANASFYNRTWLHSQSNASKVTGTPAGTYSDKAIYKYTFAIPKARFEQCIKSSSMSTKLLFMFTNGTSVWAFDNFNVEGKYTADTIDFNDGQANGVALPDWNGTRAHFQLAERVAGDYALTSTKSSGNDANFYMDVAYFVYAFHTLNAQSIQFTIYCEGVTSTTAAAFRIGLNTATGSASGDKVAARTTANVSHVLDTTNGSVTVTVTRAAYEYWFENGVYKNNANGVSSVQFIEMYTRMDGATTYFLDNFVINK